MDVVPAITRLTKIFKSKKWFDKDYDEFAYDNFCQLLEVLNSEERVLVLELTERYLWISAGEYLENIGSAFNLMSSDDLIKIKTIYLFPISKPADANKIKSGVSMLYDLKSMSFKFSKYVGKQFKLVKSFEELRDPFNLKADELLFLVDDYIGAGNTLNTCMSEVFGNVNIRAEQVVIISIGCQMETYKSLQAKGYKVYCANILPKGISDYDEPNVAEKKLALMRVIENSIPGSKKFSLGWESSEGIITLKRTPNNTFPVFWKNIKRNGKVLRAPFLRTENLLE
jgi:hypoxanthine phosphoribosyltransferase